MKKFTLALSALALSAAAAWASPTWPYEGQYVVVPAAADAQKEGMFFTVIDGKPALTNDIESAVWNVESKYDYDTWESSNYMTINGQYLSIDENGAVFSAEETPVMLEGSYEYDYGYWIAGMVNDEPVTLTNLFDAENPETCGIDGVWYFYDYTEGLTVADIENDLWTVAHPYASVIGVASSSARPYGYFLAAGPDHALYHTNTLDMNAVWDRIEDYENETISYQNLATGEYLYALNGDDACTSAEKVNIYENDSPVLYGAKGFTINAEYADNTNAVVWLNARNNNNKVTKWTLDEGSSFYLLDYSSELTAESAMATIDLNYAKSAPAQQIYNLFQCCDYGRQTASWNAELIFDAETQEELDAAIAQAHKTITSHVMNDLEGGFAWINKRTNQYVTYDANVEIVEDANHKTRSKFQLTEGADGGNSLWVIEPVVAEEETPEEPGEDPIVEPTDGDDDFGGVDPDEDNETDEPVKFYLKNIGSGLYVGQYPGKTSTGIPVAETTETAGVFTLGIGTTQIAFVFDGVDGEMCLNASDADNYGLVGWTGINDGGAGVVCSSLPLMTDANSGFAPRIELSGDYTEQDSYFGTFKTYSNVKSVILYFGEGTDLTGMGSVYVTCTDYNYETYTLGAWDGEFLVAAAAEAIDTVYAFAGWNSQGIYETFEVPCKAIILPLRNVANEPGAYIARMDAYTFAKTVEGNTYYNAEGATTPIYLEAAPESFIPGVEPAEGTVVDLPEIIFYGFNGKGIVTNWECTEPLTITCDGVEVFSATVDDMQQYDSYDYTPESPYYTIPVNFVEPGEYVMSVPAAFFNDDDYIFSGAFTMTWKIDVSDGITSISNVKVEGQGIFDLAGRRLAAPVKGINIINGKKVLVK